MEVQLASEYSGTMEGSRAGVSSSGACMIHKPVPLPYPGGADSPDAGGQPRGYTSASATTFNGFSKAEFVVWERVKDSI